MKKTRKTPGDGRYWQTLKTQARSFRKAPTPAEEALWKELRNRRLAGLKFRRQHPINRFGVDFFCPEARLVIEIDGGIHQGQEEPDAARQAFLAGLGLTVLRFGNGAVLGNREKVLAEIEKAVRG